MRKLYMIMILQLLMRFRHHNMQLLAALDYYPLSAEVKRHASVESASFNLFLEYNSGGSRSSALYNGG